MNQRVPSGTSESVHPLTPPSFFFLLGTHSITQFLTSNMICIVVTGQTHGQTHRQTHRQTDGQWEGQTEGGKDRQTYINTYIHSLYFLFNHRVSIKNELISLRNKNINNNKKFPKMYLFTRSLTMNQQVCFTGKRYPGFVRVSFNQRGMGSNSVKPEFF